MWKKPRKKKTKTHETGKSRPHNGNIINTRMISSALCIQQNGSIKRRFLSFFSIFFYFQFHFHFIVRGIPISVFAPLFRKIYARAPYDWERISCNTWRFMTPKAKTSKIIKPRPALQLLIATGWWCTKKYGFREKIANHEIKMSITNMQQPVNSHGCTQNNV